MTALGRRSMKKQIKDLNHLAKVLTLAEGGKKSISVAQVKEILKDLSVLMVECPEVMAMLINLGMK